MATKDHRLESFIWDESALSVENPEIAAQIGRYVAQQLDEVAPSAPVCFYESPPSGGFFHLRVKGAAGFAGCWNCTYRGVVAGELNRSEGVWIIDATLFLYSCGVRLCQDGRSMFELVYSRQPSGWGAWISKGWRTDEYDEFGGTEWEKGSV